MIGWLIAATMYVAAGLLVARKAAPAIAKAEDVDLSDNTDRTFLAFFALMAGVLWPLTLLFWGFTNWLLPKRGKEDQ